MEIDSTLPCRSRWLFRWFSWYAQRYVRRHFHAVRICRDGSPPVIPDGPLLIVVNHPSWWDPLIVLMMVQRITARALFAPMDADALMRYRLFARLGMFGIQRGTLAGTRQFLRCGKAALESPQSALIVSAQGHFIDPRVRPTRLMPGVGHLAARIGRGTILPLAIEYPFWSERFPEALGHFGSPINLSPSMRADEWTTRIEKALEMAQDQLAVHARERNTSQFETIIDGSAGVGGVYDRWRRIRSAMTNRKFRYEHGDES